MTLQSGSRLGPYEILSLVGAGGMGEVYKATDTRLDRTVAIKVLPAHLSDNAERRERFEREARAVSSLNHPHICTLHDVGEQEGTHYLVMEYIEGESLADRLKKGALPLEQALRCAIEIADALDKAHRQGVVHRDLKPGNIMLTKAGAKLLDFGLAKLASPTRRSHNGEFIGEGGSALPTEQKPLTEKGSILGTFQYMAPEQLEGQEADARTDIFAFGSVLYEMVTGNRAFQGKSQASLVGAILKDEPQPITELQPMSPAQLEHLVKRCLEKDSEARWQSASDAMQELAWIAETRTELSAQATERSRSKERLSWLVAAVAVLAALALVITSMFSNRDPSVHKFSVMPPEGTQFLNHQPVVSPDGKRLAITARSVSGDNVLWLRDFDSLTPKVLPGTEGAAYPFWSPDSQYIGYFSEQELKTVDLFGTPPVTLCDAPGARGGTWNNEGIIVFRRSGGLHRVSAMGESLTPLEILDISNEEVGCRWPSFLPDGHSFLCTARGVGGQPSILLGSIDTDEMKHLVNAFSNAAYAPTGHLLFVREAALLAQPFDADRLQLTGNPIPLAENVWYREGIGLGLFSVSQTGVLTYAAGTPNRQPAWFDRQGRRLESVGDPSTSCFTVSLSPDERRAARLCDDPNLLTNNIWVLDLSRQISSRLTFNTQGDDYPIWSPDGSQLIYRSDRETGRALYQRAASGDGNEIKLLDVDTIRPTDWSPDGQFILYDSDAADVNSDIWLLPLVGSVQPESFIETPFSEVDGQFSPDGQWVAYASNESGRYEVYVRPFTSEGQRHQISTSGGRYPLWRKDGSELFYVASDLNIIAVPMRTETTLEMGTPEVLFRPDWTVDWERSYEATADGQRFFVDSYAEDASAASIHVVLNWAAELEQ